MQASPSRRGTETLTAIVYSPLGLDSPVVQFCRSHPSTERTGWSSPSGRSMLAPLCSQQFYLRLRVAVLPKAAFLVRMWVEGVA